MSNKLRLSYQHFADEGTDTQLQATEQPKTFTQDDVNNIVSRESKAAVEKLLKDVGITDGGDYKASLQAFKQWQDSQKSAAELAAEQQQQAEQRAQAAEQKVAELEGKFVAASKGIPAAKIPQYLKLAETYKDKDTDLTAALDKAIADFPLASGTAKPNGGNPPPAEQQKSKKQYGNMTVL